MVTFARAEANDANQLTLVQKRAFADDTKLFRWIEAGGPPGYDSAQWNKKMMSKSFYYKIVVDSKIVGGLIIFDLGKGEYELGRIFVDTAYQNKGIGQQAIEFMHSSYSGIRKWRLETPEWAVRNHHFYEKMGYRKVRTEGPIPEGFFVFVYERIV